MTKTGQTHIIDEITGEGKGKGKIHPRTGHEGPYGSRVIVLFFPQSRSQMGWVVNATLRSLYAGKKPGTHCKRGWVSPKGRSGQVRKISTSPGFDPRTVQPVASRYTD